MNRVWTEEELDILRRDREAKVPVPVTAAKLGRPVPATYARARLIGTLVQPHQSWDEASVARLRELVSADPPMTDKRIAAELGRTVTQIRWKMQDLGLIGLRDLSKLAKVTASQMARPKAAKVPSTQVPQKTRTSPLQQRLHEGSSKPSHTVSKPTVLDPQIALAQAVKALEASMVERLRNSIAESEAGMIKAARSAIAEKARIDQRLAVRVKRASEAEARRQMAAKQANAEAQKAAAEAKRQQDEAKRKAEAAARQAREQEQEEKRLLPRVDPATSKVVGKPKPAKAALPAIQGTSQAAAPRPAPQTSAPLAPRIVVTEAPAAPRPAEADSTSGQISGRGGWKSVRRDPARVLAQAKAKAKPANRSDAVDLAQAAQAAIERFIAERGVTRSENSGIQAIVARLQARGYIVVRDENGWTIDQRHRIGSETELVAFAEARGITMSAAA